MSTNNSRMKFWDACVHHSLRNVNGGTAEEVAAIVVRIADEALALRDARAEHLRLTKPVPPKKDDPDGEGPDEFNADDAINAGPNP